MGKLFKFAIGLFFIGVGVVAIFSIMGQDNLFVSVNEDDYQYNELAYDADDFSGLDFEFSNRDLIIRTSENDQLMVNYYTTEDDTVIVDDSGAKLVLDSEVDWVHQLIGWWYRLFNREYYSVYIYVPELSGYDLTISTSNGDINLSSLEDLSDVILSTSNGDLIFDTMEADSASLHSSNGLIRLTDLVVSENLTLGTSNGRLYINDVTANIITGTTSNGRIYVDGVISNNITLSSSNGLIDFQMVGNKDDYEVNMSTSNGDLVYDGVEVIQEHFNTGASKKITLSTSNGDIKITFTEN